MNAKIKTVSALIALTSLTLHADVALSPGATWEYTFTNPTADPAWSTSSGGWSTGPAPFGNDFGGDFGYEHGTYWPADPNRTDDLWVRTTIDLTNFDLGSLLWELGVDNGFALYLNGNLLSADNAEGYTSRWEYSGALSGATSGQNFIALALEDHGGATAFDMQITGNRRTSVPDAGSTALLFGAGVVTLGVIRRRTRA